MMRYTAVITTFADFDGKWLTTGEVDVVKLVDRAAVDAMVAQRAGDVTIHINAENFGETGYVALHSTELLWADAALLDERDRATVH